MSPFSPRLRPALVVLLFPALLACERAVNVFSRWRGSNASSSSKPLGLGAEPIRFAVIGDYGSGSVEAGEVSRLVAGWNPEFIITVGDNNYPAGETSTIDTNIGKLYQAFISPYKGTFGPGATVNRFFPSLGNHDWDSSSGAAPYLAYFTLPGNERYYDFVRGNAHFFALDSDPREPDGRSASSIQGRWLQARLAAATEPFKIVYFHHPPFSSGQNGSDPAMRWPFKAWGASIVLTGHDHTYEKVVAADGLTYLVDGLGGHSRYTNWRDPPVAGSVVRFAGEHGAMLVTADSSNAVFKLITKSGAEIDSTTITAQQSTSPPVSLVSAGSSWRYWDRGIDPGPAWKDPAFDDSGWSTGTAQFGYGDGDEATTVQFGPNPNSKYATTYFRKTFTSSIPPEQYALALKTLVDDGVVVYLNGREVHRYNIPGGPVGNQTLAASAIGAPEESTFMDTSLTSAGLVNGTNVLAVEIHQGDPVSSDISFDLGLVATPIQGR